jgi:hypothetical protein
VTNPAESTSNEQVVVRLGRLPVDPLLDRRAVAGADVGVVDLPRAGVELEVALVAVATGDDAVHDAARVSQQVERLGRAPHHPAHQLAVDEVRLDRRNARPAVAAQRPEQAQLPCPEPLLAECRELGARLGEVVPTHAARLTLSCFRVGY